MLVAVTPLVLMVAYLYRVFIYPVPVFDRSVFADGTTTFVAADQVVIDELVKEVFFRSGLWIHTIVRTEGGWYAFTPFGRVYEAVGLEWPYFAVVDFHSYSDPPEIYHYPRSTKPRPGEFSP